MPAWKYIVLLFFVMASCAPAKKTDADHVFYNGVVYTADSVFNVHSAFAVKDGKIIETGSDKEILGKYRAEKKTNLEGKTVLPGLIDPHAHFWGLAKSFAEVDLKGVTSEADMLSRIGEFVRGKMPLAIKGRGWDQNVWADKAFPTRRGLDSLFPGIPVMLTRIDGHACLVNGKALELAGINENTSIEGGKIILENGELTGVLVDNAMSLLSGIAQKADLNEFKERLVEAENFCFSLGLTSVSDAGLEEYQLEFLEKLYKTKDLRIGLYAMAATDSATFDYITKKGSIDTNGYHLTSFKYYADGAMGSYGACLLSDYSDDAGNKGFLLNSEAAIQTVCEKIAATAFQLNIHCIGDSALRTVLKAYSGHLGPGNDRRWRIEHVQLCDPVTLDLFGQYKIIPSMQPTHATSDAEWVDERLGTERLRYAYALELLKNTAGVVALGTDFPVEEVNPLYTFYTAVFRKHPVTGYTASWMDAGKLSRKDALRGMTIWAAFAQFEEDRKGSLEPGKQADFIILDRDILNIPENEILATQILFTYKNGDCVYEK